MKYLIIITIFISSLLANSFDKHLYYYYNSVSPKYKIHNIKSLYSMKTLQTTDLNSYITQTRILYLVYKELRTAKNRCERNDAVKLFFIYNSLYKLNHPELKEYKKLIIVRKLISNYLKVDIDKIMGSLSLSDNCTISQRELNKHSKNFMKCMDTKGRCKDVSGLESDDIDSYDISELYKKCYKNFGTIKLLAKRDGELISILKRDKYSSLILTPNCKKIWVKNSELK